MACALLVRGRTGGAPRLWSSRARAEALFWVIPLACFAPFVSWFSSFGFYQVWRKTSFGRWWYRLDDWEQSLPTLVLMILIVVLFLFLRAADKGWRILVSVSIFALAFVITSVFADLACSIYLPPTVPSGHLTTTFLASAVARITCLWWRSQCPF